MGQQIVARWRDWSGRGIEHLVLHLGSNGSTAESVVVTTADETAFAARYRIVCDRSWRVRSLAVRLIGDDRKIDLASDGVGNWRRGAAASPELAGAIDIDLSITPFTNTLPIRRLDLPAGGHADIRAVYIRLPELTITTDPQRYTCLERGRRYRYESLDSDFTREIDVDEHGVVVTYPGLFRRVL